MSQTLASVWPGIRAMLANKISIIPVRDKSEVDGHGRSRLAKTPYGQWKQYQTKRISEQELWAEMEEYNTTAVAFLAGAVSENLLIIDIDVKWRPGIDAVIFAALKEFYPTLFSRLRIHSTPSGGFHIIYRIQEGAVPPSEKLARRAATEEELRITPKEKQKCFIETRGEGGYAVAPPSLGYGVSRDLPIPVLTRLEHEAVITLCRTYDEIPIEAVRPLPVVKQDESYYETNPFADFNNRQEGQDVLLAHGWRVSHHNKHFIWYTRPGKGDGVSASFNLEKRVFFMFTTSTEFEGQKGYLPSTALSVLEFAGDKKKTYTYLVNKGFGVIKPGVERRLAEKQAVRPGAVHLPANISAEARAHYERERQAALGRYPYGIFWEEGDKGEIKMNRERMLRVCLGMGYRVYKNEVWQVLGYLVYRCSRRQFFDGLKSYIKEDDLDQQDEILNAYESFVQRAGEFTVTRLPALEEARLLKSTKFIAYKFYTNCYLRIDRHGIAPILYDDTPHLFFAHEQQQRAFTLEAPAGLYVDFLQLATGAITPYLQQCVGYLAHEFKDEENGYIITLSEICEDPRLGGGSGKNIFSALFKHTTTFKNLPASQVQFNERFLNAWDGERILSISDLKAGFDFEFLKEPSAGSGIHKKLFKDEVSVDASDMPKLILSTNFAAKNSDGGLDRRIRSIEFTDFFTKSGGVRKHFGKMFTSDWDERDWSGYDNFMASSIQAFFIAGGQIEKKELTESGWVKQFTMNFDFLTHQFISENIAAWRAAVYVSITDFNAQYAAFCHENNVGQRYIATSMKMNRALREYCAHVGLSGFEADTAHRNPATGQTEKCKMFAENAPF